MNIDQLLEHTAKRLLRFLLRGGSLVLALLFGAGALGALVSYHWVGALVSAYLALMFWFLAFEDLD